MNLCFVQNSTTNAKKLSKFLSFTLAGVMFCFVMSLTSHAEACRDCPFPLKTGENTWLMPNGQLEVRIVETKVAGPGHLVQTSIEVYDANTHQLMAQGTLRGVPSSNRVLVRLHDMHGRPVTAEIEWMDKKREQVRIELACGAASCSLEDMIE